MSTTRTNQAAFVESIFHDRFRVAGIRMRPFSLGHLFLLTRLDHPTVIGGNRRLDAAWLALGIVVCAFPWSFSAWLVQTFAGRLLVRVVGIMISRSRRVMAQWHAYIRANVDGPKAWDSEGSSPVNSPFWVLVLTTLVSRLGLTFVASMDFPASRARWLCSVIWDEQGMTHLVNDTELEIMRELNANPVGGAVNGKEANHGRG